LPALAEEGIVIKHYRELRTRERRIADDYFAEHIFPILTPQAVDPGHPFPYISNLSLNMGVMVGPGDGKSPDSDVRGVGSRFARIKLPPSVPRLIPVDERGVKFTLLGSVVAANLESLFPKMKVGKPHLFRITRDADFEIREDEAGDLMRTM